MRLLRHHQPAFISAVFPYSSVGWDRTTDLKVMTLVQLPTVLLPAAAAELPSVLLPVAAAELPSVLLPAAAAVLAVLFPKTVPA